jgi:hypothetical protein
MKRLLMEQKCSNCLYYRQSEVVEYAGLCANFAPYERETLHHRDSWCSKWADKSDVKRDFTSGQHCGNCGWGRQSWRDGEVVCGAPTSAAAMKQINKNISPYYYMEKHEGADCEAWKEAE